MINWRVFDKKQTVLAMQLVDDEMRYVLCQGEKVLKAGALKLSAHAVSAGRVVSPDALQSALNPILNGFKGCVAVMLPSDFVHTHLLSLPKGLDAEERDYQMMRHITQTLGLQMADVYYDWVALGEAQDPKEEHLLMTVARQSDVSVYGHVFNGNWQVRWVCPECFVWSHAFSEQQAKVLVVRVERNQLSVWHVDGSGQAHYLQRQFSAQMMTQAGFVYQAVLDDGQSDVLLPTGFVVEEIVQTVTQWLGGEQMRDIRALFGLGSGVDWNLAKFALQQKLGVPVKGVLTERIDSLSDRADVHKLGGLWHLATQVQG
ncbi:hypothetical protein [Hydromonas duriensis]|uniref:Tfp pilus assembly PilM family ATPase n=1 Tax=Hydromonas duriensis TaxID=1527608 RepID=A0A4R6YBG2_9BURK|nr:hypothetical protein [Hydromonas duriensis]TDR33007.1 Tfp pilus assembly PilM family ATPase [Hydromonas duriensis]